MKNRLVLVTGATGGLGTAICKKLYQDGYKVVGSYRSKTKAEQWINNMKKEGYDIPLFYADVSNFDSVRQMVTEIERVVGSIDILINNAGITRDTRCLKMTFEQWDDVLKTNLYSVFNCTRNVIEKMIERKFGRIINISSVNGQRGQIGQTNYSAAKAGMHGFTKALALEVAKHGITVNTISPGYVATDMVMAVREDILQKIIEQVPLGRLGGTHEIAFLVSFLAGEDAGFITGANYSINGGQHMY